MGVENLKGGEEILKQTLKNWKALKQNKKNHSLSHKIRIDWIC